MDRLVSLVIPVRNEMRSIDALLASIEQQRRPPDEVVLVDGASDDGTSDKIATWAKTTSLRVTHLRLGHAVYPGGARNRGVRAAAHPWIAFTDAGITLDPAWLEELVAALDAGQVAFGDFEPRLVDRFSEIAALAYVLPKMPSPAGPCRPPSVASMIMSRSLFERTGGFPEELRSSEDLLFLRRLYALDERIARAPRARVTWNLASGVQATFARFRNYSRHSVAAGLFDNWQGPVLKKYLLIGVGGIVASVFAGPLVGISIGGGGVMALLLLRGGRACWSHRHELPAPLSAWVLRLPAVAGLLAVIDAAAVLGVFDWYLARGNAPEARTC